jgi:hypothetical protein
MGASIAELAKQLIPGFRNRTAKEKLVQLIRVSEYLMTDAEFQGAINQVKKLYGRGLFFTGKAKRKIDEIQHLMTGYRSALQNHSKYRDYLGMTAADLLKSVARVNQLWRKKSKGGLYYACFFSPNDIVVHYCLDGLDLDKVIGKSVSSIDTPSTHAPVNKQRAITSSELRWIYRNRYIPNVRERIQFWRPNLAGFYVPCTPPWEWPIAEGGDWSQYKPTNAAPGADQP